MTESLRLSSDLTTHSIRGRCNVTTTSRIRIVGSGTRLESVVSCLLSRAVLHRPAYCLPQVSDSCFRAVICGLSSESHGYDLIALGAARSRAFDATSHPVSNVSNQQER
jgi:hypothetical protein